MDLIILCFSLVVVVLISSIFSFRSKKIKAKFHKLPPGSFGFPIIGESLKFMSVSQNNNPETFLKERMTKYSPDIFKTFIAGENVAVLCGPGGNKFVFGNDNRDMIKPWWPSSVKKIMTSKGSSIGDNKTMRILVSQFLRPEGLKEYVPIMDSLTRKYMAENFAYNQVINASDSVKKIAFALSCRLFMNLEESAQVSLLYTHFPNILPGLLSAPVNFPGTAYNRAIKSAKCIREMLYPIIMQRRNEILYNDSDMLTYLVGSTKADDRTYLNEIADSILSVLVASHDTTSSVMAMIFHFLADNPHVYTTRKTGIRDQQVRR